MGIYKKAGTILGITLIIIATAITLNSGSNQVIKRQSGSAVTDDLDYNSSLYKELTFQYDTFIRNTLLKENIPGLAVVIIKNDKVILMKGYGVKKSGGNDSVDVNTVFRLGSVSKGFASVLTGILINENKLSWDDQVIRFLPEFSLKNPEYTKRLTVRHVLSQTSGLPMHTYTDLLDDNVPFSQIKPLLSGVDPISPPGKEYSYQNVMYSIIADVLNSATGKDYKTLVKERIFVPLNMQHASLDYNTICCDSNVAYPHLYAGNNLWKPQKLNDRYYTVAPASGVNASISDMAMWLKALIGDYPEFIPENALNEIFKPQIVTPIKRKFKHSWKNLDKLYYGLGWRIFECNGEKIIYHGGYVKGYRAEISIDSKDQTGIVVLFNANCRLSNFCIPRFWEYYFYNKKCLTSEKSGTLTSLKDQFHNNQLFSFPAY